MTLKKVLCAAIVCLFMAVPAGLCADAARTASHALLVCEAHVPAGFTYNVKDQAYPKTCIYKSSQLADKAIQACVDATPKGFIVDSYVAGGYHVCEHGKN